MSKAALRKKLEHISVLLAELETLLTKPFANLAADHLSLHAAERKFLLIVELASEINTSLILDASGKTPDSYRESFTGLRRLGIIAEELLGQLADSAKLRNILSHEYDFESDDRKFYDFTKDVVPAYREYLKAVLTFLDK